MSQAKFFLIPIFIFTFTFNLYSKTEPPVMIYNGSFYGIKNFKSVKYINSDRKAIYIQNGINYNLYVNNPNESGKYLQLNKTDGSWYVPFQGFLNGKWYWVDWKEPHQLSLVTVRGFEVSPFDSNIVIKNGVFWIFSYVDADEFTTMTTNGGSNFFTPFHDTYNPVYSSGCTSGGFDLWDDEFSLPNMYKLLMGYNWNTGFQGTIQRGILKNELFNSGLIDTIPQLRSVCSGGFVKINPFKPDYIFTIGNKMMLSTTSGTNFFELPVPPLKTLAWGYKDSLIAGITSNKLYRSFNRGLTWDSLPMPFSANCLEISPDNSNVMFAGSDSGLYRTDNKGVNWYLFNNGFMYSKKVIGISKDKNSGDTIYAATDKGVFLLWTSYLVNVINTGENIPLVFSLNQNYPNPFNPATRINYEVPVSGLISLKIFDITGKLVSTLVNEVKSPGNYIVEFNAGNLSSGTYFYRLEGQNFIETKKMLLIK